MQVTAKVAHNNIVRLHLLLRLLCEILSQDLNGRSKLFSKPSSPLVPQQELLDKPTLLLSLPGRHLYRSTSTSVYLCWTQEICPHVHVDSSSARSERLAHQLCSVVFPCSHAHALQDVGKFSEMRPDVLDIVTKGVACPRHAAGSKFLLAGRNVRFHVPRPHRQPRHPGYILRHQSARRAIQEAGTQLR